MRGLLNHPANSAAQIGRLQAAVNELRVGHAFARTADEQQAWVALALALGTPLNFAAPALAVANEDYPLPPLEPKGGFTLEKALVYAIVRQESRFERFQPWLGRIVLLKREEALCLGGPTVYDSLLAEFEPGISAAEVAQHFEELGRELSSLRTAALAAQERWPAKTRADLFVRDFPVAAGGTGEAMPE